MTNTTKALNVTELTKLGASLAVVFNTSEIQAQTAKRQAILAIAKDHATDNDKVKAILTGYATKLLEFKYSDSVVKVRKSEANTVFKAVAMTSSTGENLKALLSHSGHYNDFIDLARSLAGKVERSSKEPATRKDTVLTDIQVTQVDDKLTKASASQLADFVDTASVQMNKIVAPNMAGMQQLILINSIANNMVNNKDLEDYVISVAQDIADTSQVSIERLRKAMQDASKVQNAAKNNVTLQEESII